MAGSAEIQTPRDPAGMFRSQLAGKRQTRPAELDDNILGLYSRPGLADA